MIIDKLDILNREDFAITDIDDIDTEEISIEKFADMLCILMYEEWGYSVELRRIEGDWNDEFIDIYMIDLDTGHDWYAMVNMEAKDVIIERQ